MTTSDASQPTEIRDLGQANNLAQRILGGEVIVLRNGLQQLGLFEEFVDLSLQAIRSSAGDDAATNAKKEGFDRIHEWVEPSGLPRVTDAVYQVMAGHVHTTLDKVVGTVFPDAGNYYYERSPNVRFHIPYEIAARHKQQFSKFAGSHGDGKITAHGPHRDPWVDCPDNAINLWIAIGPVHRGNGLTIYAKDYERKLAFNSGYISPTEQLQAPLTFELEPGDAILFHSDHLHGSELNTTDSTRFVVSNRICFGKPHFPYGHHHHYLHAGLARGPLRWLAQTPAKLQASYLRDRIRRACQKVGLLNSKGSNQASSGNESDHEEKHDPVAARPSEDGSLDLEGFAVNEIRGVSKKVCVVRLGKTEFAALSRRCPHAGGDLSAGWIANGRPVCPWHNLSFDPTTGASACPGLPPLTTYSFEIRKNRLYVNPSETPTED